MKIAKDIMQSNIITIGKETNLKEIIEIMKTKGIGVIPVLTDGKVDGVVTRDDILTKGEEAPLPPVIAFWDILITLPTNREFEEKLKKLSGYTAEEIMTIKYLSVTEEQTAEKIITDMLEKKYNFAIVLDSEQKIKGLITKSDLINKSF